MATLPVDPDDVVEATKSEDPENIADNIDPSKLPRGASEGPLAKLIPVYVDVETFMSDTVSLDDMTLRQYLAASYLTALAVAIGNTDPVQVFYTEKNPGPPGASMVTDDIRQVLVYLASDPNYVFVAHNASFDMRVLRFHLGVPHPINVWCSMEGSMAAWPETPGGFSLKNLAKRLRLPKDRCKLDLDLLRLQKVQDKAPIAAAKVDELIRSQMKEILNVGGIPWPADDVITKDLCSFVLAIYNQRDVEAMRDIFLLQAARIPAVEQGVALRTHHQRRHHFIVDSSKLDEFVEKMDENAAYAEKEVEAMVGTGDLRAVFNRDNDNGILTSIRYKRLKKLVNDKLAQEEFESTSLKKLSPLQLARNPKVFELLTQTTRAGKMMSHKRRAKIFHGVTEVDTELGFARAHTMRFSSPSTGKGLNLHNVPKHDKAIAEPVRKLFRVPPGYCLVRGDLANVEFRIEGYLTGAVNVFKMFEPLKGGNPFTDPYSSTWQNMTSMKISKKDPVRQVAKSATLGLGFCLDGDTPVVTMSGVKLIKDILPGDKLWNGSAWVKAGGAIKTGRKQCIRLGNTWLTEDHQVWWNGWHLAADVADALATKLRERASASGAGLSSLPSSMSGSNVASPFDATAELNLLFGSTSSTGAGVSSAESVPTPGADNAGEPQGSSRDSSLTPVSAAGGSQPTTTSELGAQSLTTNNTTTTEDAESSSVCPPKNGSFTSKPYEGGTTGLSFWIGKTTTSTTKLEISNSSRLPLLSETLECIREERDVYDILDVEDGHRFQAGDWLVHNCMSPPGYAKVLLNVLADKKSGVTEQILHDIIIKNFWHMPQGDRVSRIMTMLGCSQTVALSSYQIHKLFNEAYPEFRRTAYWLVKVIEEVAASGTDRDQARRRIDEMYKTTDAPNRDLIGLEIDDDPLTLYPSVRACCGPWPRTVCWREPHMRKTDFAGADDQKKLTIRKATGEYKIFTPQLAIENVTQAAARNALCMGVEHLDKMGFRDVIHVHDEIMILCKREREHVLAARDALLTCFGPKHTMPYSWSILVKPEEITLTESLYEDENDVAVTIKNKEGQEVPGPDRWGRIERNEPGCLLNLP